MTNLPTMTGVALYDLMDQLHLRSEQMSKEWRDAVENPVVHPISREICGANAKKWAKIAEIFKDAKSRIYDVAGKEFKEESCGA